MQDINDFIRAAAPWIAMGACILVLITRDMAKENGKSETENFVLLGMCLGMCAGPGIDVALGGHCGWGIAIGLPAGLAIGSRISKETKNQNQQNASSTQTDGAHVEPFACGQNEKDRRNRP